MSRKVNESELLRLRHLVRLRRGGFPLQCLTCASSDQRPDGMDLRPRKLESRVLRTDTLGVTDSQQSLRLRVPLRAELARQITQGRRNRNSRILDPEVIRPGAAWQRLR